MGLLDLLGGLGKADAAPWMDRLSSNRGGGGALGQYLQKLRNIDYTRADDQQQAAAQPPVVNDDPWSGMRDQQPPIVDGDPWAGMRTVSGDPQQREPWSNMRAPPVVPPEQQTAQRGKPTPTLAEIVAMILQQNRRV